jgi:hypothetical protein
LQPYLPPTLSLPFEEKIREFGESKDVNEKWKIANPQSPLQVLLLLAVKSAHIQTSFAHLRLPKLFAVMQQQFESFYRKLSGSGKIRFQWIFEDNLVTFRFATPEKFDLQLKVPLFLAVIFVIICEYRNPTIAKISEVSGLTVKHVKALVNRGTGQEFPILCVGADERTRFNPDFETRRKKLFIVHPAFSLRKPPKFENEPRSDELAVRLKYQSCIARILKDLRCAAMEKLEREVQMEFRKHRFPFRKDEYERALLCLDTNKFIRRDPLHPDQYLYVE